MPSACAAKHSRGLSDVSQGSLSARPVRRLSLALARRDGRRSGETQGCRVAVCLPLNSAATADPCATLEAAVGSQHLATRHCLRRPSPLTRRRRGPRPGRALGGSADKGCSSRTGLGKERRRPVCTRRAGRLDGVGGGGARRAARHAGGGLPAGCGRGATALGEGGCPRAPRRRNGVVDACRARTGCAASRAGPGWARLDRRGERCEGRRAGESDEPEAVGSGCREGGAVLRRRPD